MSGLRFEAATVVGATGFLGRHLARDLGRRGLEVHVPEPGDWTWVGEPQDLVVWAGGLEADPFADPARTIEGHAWALAELAARGAYRSLIYLSSTALYDGGTGRVDETTPLALDPAEPRHLYDLSKALGEWVVRHRGGPRGRVARVASVYGDALDGGSLLEALIEHALEGGGREVDVAPDQAGDYVHIDDVGEAVWAIATRGEAPLYLVASGETVDARTLLGILSERTGTVMEAVRPPLGMTAPVLDPKRLASELSVTPRAAIDGLDRVLTWQDNQRAMRSMLEVTQMPWMG